MFPSWAKNILFLLVCVLSGLTLVLIIEGLLGGNELLPLNIAVEQAMIHLRTPFLTDFLVLVTNIGSPFVLSCVAIFIAVMLFIKKKIYDASLLAAAMLVSIVSLTILKNIFKVSRPASEIFNFSGWSFPSGHTTITTALFFVLAYIFFDKVKTTAGKINLVLGFILAVALVCLSRLYLGAHWALDVLAGVSLGLLTVSFTVLVFTVFIEGRRFDRKKLGLWSR